MASSERIVAGIGCSSSATSTEMIGLIEACLVEAGATARQLVALGSHIRKERSAVLAATAAYFEVPLRLLDDHDLAAGVPGTAEAVAAAAGPLRLGKRKSRYSTCAIAVCDVAFSVGAFGQAPRSSASIAPSMLATSSAGP